MYSLFFHFYQNQLMTAALLITANWFSAFHLTMQFLVIQLKFSHHDLNQFVEIFYLITRHLVRTFLKQYKLQPIF